MSIYSSQTLGRISLARKHSLDGFCAVLNAKAIVEAGHSAAKCDQMLRGALESLRSASAYIIAALESPPGPVSSEALEPTMTGDEAMRIIDRLNAEFARDEAIQSGKVSRLPTRARAIPTDAECDAINPKSHRLFADDALIPTNQIDRPCDTEAADHGDPAA